ncbi:MAG: hypothetical protein ACE5QV_07815, partial [Fidelibacterota bacterium]
SLFKSENDYYIIVVNNGLEGKVAELKFGEGIVENVIFEVEDLFANCKWKFDSNSGQSIFVNLEARSGTILHLSPL